MIYFYYYLLSCIFVYLSYRGVNNYLTQKSLRYRNLKYEKQTYVVANIVKSIVLLFITPLCIIFLHKLFYGISEEIYNYTFIFTSIYASTDMVSLLFERGKKLSTIYHHIFVQLAAFTCIYLGTFNTFADIIIIYGSFATFAYLVNFYLAIRFLVSNKCVELKYLAGFAYIIYIISCFVNWTIQIVYLYSFLINGYFITSGLLLLFNYVVINDDLILMEFLRKNSFILKIKWLSFGFLWIPMDSYGFI